jgi:hypothetical protein
MQTDVTALQLLQVDNLNILWVRLAKKVESHCLRVQPISKFYVNIVVKFSFFPWKGVKKVEKHCSRGKITNPKVNSIFSLLIGHHVTSSLIS